MDIWIIQDGEKVGPIHDFEVRKRIGNGEFPANTPAWHEGLPAWKPLGEISLFEREFGPALGASEPPAQGADVDESAPPPLPGSCFALRRFWARWLDLYLFAGVWWIVMWFAGRDIGAVLNDPWTMMFLYVPWFVLETILLHRYGTTPGKWMLGLRVVNQNGSLLSLGAAARRSARVLFLGIGLGWSLISVVCQIMALGVTKRLGRPLWDHVGGHRVTAAPLHPMRLVGYVFVFFTALQLQMIVIAPHVMETAARTFPSLKEQLEKNPPWHLPERR
jgi:uncharacterized RDD family membrane protein YckC